LIQPKPPINMQRNNPILKEFPSESPAISPGSGSQLAPGGRGLQLVWSSARFVHFGWLRKFGCSTRLSCHCNDDFTCPLISSPTPIPFSVKKRLERSASTTKVTLGDLANRIQQREIFSGILILCETQNPPRLASVQQISKRSFLSEYRLNHSGFLLLKSPASIPL